MKKLISFVLCICMVITLLPARTLQAEEQSFDSPDFVIHTDLVTGDSSSVPEEESGQDEDSSVISDSSEEESSEESSEEPDTEEGGSSDGSDDTSVSPEENPMEDPTAEDSSAEESNESQEDSSQESSPEEPEKEDSDEAEPDAWTQAFLERLEQYLNELASTPMTIANDDAGIGDFPEDYQAGLEALHKKYPNWQFKAIDTGLDWYTVIHQESSYNRSLVPTTSSDLLKSNAKGDFDTSTGKYVLKDSSSWVSGTRSAVGYFMDPRNFLDEQHIFMFETNAYSDLHTPEAVEAILNGTFMSKKNSPAISYLDRNGKTVSPKPPVTYSEVIWGAGKEAKVSPVYLAAKIRQEVGVNGSGSTSGKYGKYPGIYNYYNIGASDSADPVSNGLNWASTGTSFNRPWTSPMKSIEGGATYIGEQYINKGRDTGYFMRFNISPDRYYTLYSHQYMTNVSGAASEANTTYNAYKGISGLKTTHVFYIPVFKNMPSRDTVAAFADSKGTGVVNADVNVRNQASISGSKMTTASKGTKVTILGGSMDTGIYSYSVLSSPYWYKVKFEKSGTTGYICAEYVTVDSSVSVKVGEDKKLSLAKDSLQDTSKLYFETSDPRIATVSADGTVTGVKEGRATIYVHTGVGNYDAIGVTVAGKAPAKKDIAGSGITVDAIPNQAFKGSAIKPSVTVKNGKTVLKEGSDYTVSYSGNTTPGTGTVTITGKGSYTGSRKVTFKITETLQKYQTTENLNYRKGPGLSYDIVDGLKKGSTVEVVSGYSKKADGYTWYMVKVSGKYYYAVSAYLKKAAAAVTYKVTFDANGGSVSPASKTYQKNAKYGALPTAKRAGYVFQGWYTKKSGGSKVTSSSKVTAKITLYAQWKKSISASSVKVSSIATQTFKGSAVKPSVTVKDGSTTLKSGTHYTLSYSGNTTPGTATVTITGKGTYTGSRKVTFKITEKLIDYKTTDNLNYRTGPGTSKSRVGTIKKGSTVKVVSGYSKKANGYTWYMIKVSGKYYYAASSYLKKVSTSSGSTTGTASKETLTSYKTTDNLNYRTGPGTSKSRAGTIKKGSTVKVVSGYSKKANGYTWYKIKIGNKYYYVASAYLKK